MLFWLGSILSICAVVAVTPSPLVVHPADVEAALAQRQQSLKEALLRASVPLLKLDFETTETGPLGIGEHGEQALDGRFILGYVGSASRRAADFDIAVVQEKANRSLRLVDCQAAAALYVRAPIEENAGILRFDLNFSQVGPLTIMIDLYQAALVLPSANDWEQWFPGRPYLSKFVYLEGLGTDDEDPRRPRFTPTAIGGSIEPGRTYRLAIQWDNARRQANVWIDDRQVVRQKRFLSKGEALSSFVCWRTGSYGNEGLGSEQVEVLVDQIEVVAQRWRLPASEPSP